MYAHTEAGSLLYFARTFYLFCFSSILLFNSLLTPPIEVFSDFCLFDNVYLIICLLQRAKWVLTCHLDILNLHKLILNCLLSCIFLAAPVTVFQICVCMCMLSRIWPFVTPRTVAYWIPGKNTGLGCHFLIQRIFPPQGVDPSLEFPALAGRFFTTVSFGKPCSKSTK